MNPNVFNGDYDKDMELLFALYQVAFWASQLGPDWSSAGPDRELVLAHLYRLACSSLQAISKYHADPNRPAGNCSHARDVATWLDGLL